MNIQYVYKVITALKVCKTLAVQHPREMKIYDMEIIFMLNFSLKLELQIWNTGLPWMLYFMCDGRVNNQLRRKIADVHLVGLQIPNNLLILLAASILYVPYKSIYCMYVSDFVCRC